MFFKKNYIEINFYTNNPLAYNYHKPEKANNFIPQEWKELPKYTKTKLIHSQVSNVNNPTIKNCPAIKQLYSLGFIIPFWGDLEIGIDEEGKIRTTNDEQYSNVDFSSHKPAQLGNFFPGWKQVKFHCPWQIITSEYVPFLITDCTWSNSNLKSNMTFLNGIMDFFYNHGTNLNCFIKFNSFLELKAGIPFAHAIPITNKKLKYNYHYIETPGMLDFHVKKSKLPFAYPNHKKSGRYKFQIQQRKKELGYCPFSNWWNKNE